MSDWHIERVTYHRMYAKLLFDPWRIWPWENTL